jgi:TonB family protein
MKLRIFAFVIILIMVGCQGKAEEPKVISVDDQKYLSSFEVDTPAKLEMEQSGQNVIDILNNEMSKSQAYMDLMPEKMDRSYVYRLLISEKGSVDRIIILKSMNEELDEIVTRNLLKWIFTPALKEGTNVKFQYDWDYTESEFYASADKLPKPLEGSSAINKKIVYPETARKMGIQGSVFVKAYIDEEGNVTKTELIKGISSDCDEEAMRAIKATKFQPAELNGIPVKAQISVTVRYKLE